MSQPSNYTEQSNRYGAFSMKNLISTLAGFCLLGLLSTTPALGQAATDVKCDGCVQSGDIATNGVRRGDIQNFSINTPKLNNFAVTTEKIKTGAVTTDKIADGAITADKLAAGADLSNEVSILQGEQAVQNDRLDVLETKRGLLDQNELSSIWSNSLNTHFDLIKIGNDLYSCGQSYLYGCDRAISGNATEYGGLGYEPRTASVFFWDPVAYTRIYAIPTDIGAGYGELRFVGVANLTAHRDRGQMLVDDCDNPMVGYVQESRSQRDYAPPQSVMNNSGQLYELDNFNSVDVDVTGNTYGVMNFIIHTDITTPICTPGVSDRTGIWQRYAYTFVLDLNEARFAGPYTYQGSSIGLLDRVEALENPPPIPPPPS